MQPTKPAGAQRGVKITEWKLSISRLSFHTNLERREEGAKGLWLHENGKKRSMQNGSRFSQQMCLQSREQTNTHARTHSLSLSQRLRHQMFAKLGAWKRDHTKWLKTKYIDKGDKGQACVRSFFFPWISRLSMHTRKRSAGYSSSKSSEITTMLLNPMKAWTTTARKGDGDPQQFRDPFDE